jgi:hypothetical protein
MRMMNATRKMPERMPPSAIAFVKGMVDWGERGGRAGSPVGRFSERVL